MATTKGGHGEYKRGNGVQPLSAILLLPPSSLASPFSICCHHLSPPVTPVVMGAPFPTHPEKPQGKSSDYEASRGPPLPLPLPLGLLLPPPDSSLACSHVFTVFLIRGHVSVAG